MSKKISKPLTIAMGTALVGGLTAAAASAEIITDQNPFAMEELSSGQLFAGAHGGEGEGSCGEGKCGEDKGEGSCGEDKGEGSCGEDKGEGSCGGDKGEGSCGGAA